ncbi:serine hydrolase domain-containing protein [Vibrio sp. WXL210]|uniref:serine hydrolase domain-containing protein n=1 Tax=Vibrio sp. WXL210 TaxID=3450709 RepID=UPI003EC8D804
MKKTLIAGLVALGLTSGVSATVMDTVPAAPEKQATLMNWGAQPFNHWTFRNVGIQPNVMVPRGGDIVKIPEAINSDIANIRFEYEGEEITLRQAMINDHTDGFVVVHKGEIIYEEYFNEFTERDHHLWASSTKSLTGQLMGLLVEQGKVDVDAKVESYIPELKGKHFGQRTVREVLNMVTALDYSEDYENMVPGAMVTEYFSRVGFAPAIQYYGIDPTKDDTPRGLLEFAPMFTQNPDLEPGYKFEYHSPNVDVIGWIISRVSGQPLQTFIADNVWNKLGVEHDAFYWTDPSFNPIATGGFNTTLRDFARVGMAIANDGKYNGEQVFAKDWVKDTFALTDEERLHTERSIYKVEGAAAYDPQLEGYKNYMWVHDSEKGIGTFRGVFGQVMYINQEQDLVIASFSSAASASNARRTENKVRMISHDAVAEHLK